LLWPPTTGTPKCFDAARKPAMIGVAWASPAAHTASTTARGRPPIAAMSERLTMMPHQPANHGSPATNSFMKPSMAKSR
jgi:hypothetical protein